MLSSQSVRRWIGWTMAAILVLSVVTWWVTHPRLPAQIRVATARKGGQYHRLGTLVARELRDLTGRDAVAVPTQGSVENRRLLLDGEVDLAILQAGSASLDGLVVITPLHRDVVHVIVRRDGDLHRVPDLAGRRVVTGPPGSGLRTQARLVLDFHGLPAADVTHAEAYFTSLRDDPSLDAAVVTTGVSNPDLNGLLAGGDYRLLPLDAAALSLRKAFLHRFVLPRGLYAERPPVPAADTSTVCTTALLVAREDVPAVLVGDALDAVYLRSLRLSLPDMLPRPEASQWSDVPLHPVTRRFFDPHAGLDVLATVMESLAAGKELLFALGAALFLAWSRWNRLKEEEQSRELRAQKDRLDVLLDKTVRIEREQVGERDPARLKEHLDQLTAIKLEALEELSHEDLRGDRMFLIFLTHCASLSQKLQAKMDAS